MFPPTTAGSTFSVAPLSVMEKNIVVAELEVSGLVWAVPPYVRRRCGRTSSKATCGALTAGETRTWPSSSNEM
jgi:hypothetical protein